MQPPKTVPWWTRVIEAQLALSQLSPGSGSWKRECWRKALFERPEMDSSCNLSRLDCSEQEDKEGPPVFFTVQELKQWVWARAAWQRKEEGPYRKWLVSPKVFCQPKNSGYRRQSTNMVSLKSNNPHLRTKIVSLIAYLPPLRSVLKEGWLFVSYPHFFYIEVWFSSVNK